MVDYKYHDLFWQGSVDKKWKIEYDGGAISNEIIFSQSIEISESLCSEAELRFGCCEASSFKFKVANIVRPLINEWLTVSVVLDHHEDSPLRIGRYKVASDKATADRRHREIVAYDAMYDILNANVGRWYSSVLPEIGSTIRMKEFRTSFASHFNLGQVVPEGGLANDDMVIERTIGANGTEELVNGTMDFFLPVAEISGKDVITAICEINGCFGHIGRDGKFHYIYLQPNIQGLYPSDNLFPDHSPDYLPQAKSGHLYPQDPNSYLIGRDKYIECHYEDFVTKTIDKLQIRQEENDVGQVWPEGDVSPKDNCYIIEDNFLVYGKSSDELRVVAENIYQKIHEIVYRPFECDAIGNPCLEVGDPVSFPTRYDIVESYIIQRTLKGTQALRDNLKADGVESYGENVNSVSKSIVQLKGKTNTLIRNVDETRLEIKDVETGLSSRITQLVDSISISVTNGEKEASVTLHIKDGETSYDIVSENINFTGLVSFTNLETSGQTIINGDNITAGTINTNRIEVTDKLVLKDSSVGEQTVVQLKKSNQYNRTGLFIGGDFDSSKSYDVMFENYVYFHRAAYFSYAINCYKSVYFGIDARPGSYNHDFRLDADGTVIGKGFILLVSDTEYDSLGYDSANNRIYIGSGSLPLRIRGTTITSAHEITTSDERLKNSFKSLDGFEGAYMDLEPCAFKYNDGTSDRFHFGFKAQNVRDSLLNNGFTTQDFAGFAQMTDNSESPDYSGIDDPMGLRYAEFISWNTHMIQKLYRIVEMQQEEIDHLKQRIGKE